MADVETAAARLSAALDKLEAVVNSGGAPLPTAAPDATERLNAMEKQLEQAIQELAPIMAALGRSGPDA